MSDKVFNPANISRLEDPERLVWLPPGEIAGQLALTPGINIADIGAGTGFFAIPFAHAIGPHGRVYAVDLQAPMLEFLSRKLQRPGSPSNIELEQGSAAATGLPAASCDLVFQANVWHEIAGHAAALREAARILRPGGRLAILDWRTDVTQPPGPPLDHRIDVPLVLAALATHGFAVSSTGPVGLYNYLVIATRHP
jgi:ubiquinone/menaquinone biosynthesis C-methylase UbiE